MEKLILSEENYEYGLDIEFKPSKNGLYQYRQWLTDGWLLLDTQKTYKGQILGVKTITKDTYNSTIEPFVNKEYLQDVLQEKNRVEFSDISYKGYTLAKIGKKERCIDSYFAEQIKCLECFFKDDKYFFFALNEANETIDIDFDSYMFMGLVMGMKNNKYTKDVITILSKLDKYLNCIGG